MAGVRWSFVIGISVFGEIAVNDGFVYVVDVEEDAVEEECVDDGDEGDDDEGEGEDADRMEFSLPFAILESSLGLDLFDDLSRSLLP